jgi:hypothetical protein
MTGTDPDRVAAATGAEVLARLGGDPRRNVNGFMGYNDPTLKAQRWV